MTRPPKYDLYEIFCAILYFLKEGCSWRAIPHDFPKWGSVRYYYDIWAKEDEFGISLLDEILDKLVSMQYRQMDVMNLQQWLLWIQKAFKMLTLLKPKDMTQVRASVHRRFKLYPNVGLLNALLHG